MEFVLISAAIFAAAAAGNPECLRAKIEKPELLSIYNDGVTAIAEKRFDDAITLMQCVVDNQAAFDPNANWRHNPVHKLGWAYMCKGEVEKGIALQKEALTFKPRWNVAAFKIGYGYFRLKDYGQAASWFGKSFEYAPDWLPAEAWLGASLYEAGRLDEAREHLINAAAQEHAYTQLAKDYIARLPE